GEQHVAHVLPLRRATVRPGITYNAAAAVFVREAERYRSVGALEVVSETGGNRLIPPPGSTGAAGRLGVARRAANQAARVGAGIAKVASGSGRNRFGPSVPLVTYQINRMIQPISGMKPSKIHQPVRSRSCSRRIAMAMLGMMVTRPKSPVTSWIPSAWSI